jgi:hypothetical protein
MPCSATSLSSDHRSQSDTVFPSTTTRLLIEVHAPYESLPDMNVSGKRGPCMLTLMPLLWQPAEPNQLQSIDPAADDTAAPASSLRNRLKFLDVMHSKLLACRDAWNGFWTRPSAKLGNMGDCTDVATDRKLARYRLSVA